MAAYRRRCCPRCWTRTPRCTRGSSRRRSSRRSRSRRTATGRRRSRWSAGSTRARSHWTRARRRLFAAAWTLSAPGKAGSWTSSQFTPVSFPAITDLKQLCCAFSTTFVAFFTPAPRFRRQSASPLGMAPGGSHWQGDEQEREPREPDDSLRSAHQHPRGFASAPDTRGHEPTGAAGLAAFQL